MIKMVSSRGHRFEIAITLIEWMIRGFGECNGILGSFGYCWTKRNSPLRYGDKRDGTLGVSLDNIKVSLCLCVSLMSFVIAKILDI